MSNINDEQFDIELKQSLDAAFDKEQISVSEDLIASTLAKIKALDNDPAGKTVDNGKSSGDEVLSKSTALEKNVDVVNLTEDGRAHV